MKTCPLMRAPCMEHGCHWYIQLLGKHPQKDAPVEEWNCSIAFLPILMIESAQQARQTGAAVESARNEARKDAVAVAASVVHLAETVVQKKSAAQQSAPDARIGFMGRLRLAFKGGQ